MPGATLPRVLAGPIVRRVEPNACSVWLATSEAADVTLKLYAGTAMASSAGAPVASSQATSLRRFGEHLYVGVIQVKLDAAAGSPPLTPGGLYSYDIALSGASGGSDLAGEGLLEDRPAAEGRPAQLALGYVKGRLPSFVAAPASIDRLRLAHASCRKSHGKGPDAMAWLDDAIADDYANVADKRPQQLFLTGDQIYADDVPACLLPMLNRLGSDLLGYEEFVTLHNADGSWTAALRGNLRHLPTYRRRKLIREAARMSTTDADSHLITFGEFAAMYLAAWSPRVWRELAPSAEIFAAVDASLAPQHKAMLMDWEACYPGGSTPQENWQKARGEGIEKERERVIAWRDAVSKVARVLANVATYMIWDDHEITDDWNLNKRWRNRVLRTALGKDIIRNGCMAYGLFQGWGNDPDAFAKADSPNKKFIDETAALLGQPPTAAPADTGADETSNLSRLNVLFGIAGEDAGKQVVWHYRVAGPRHLVIVLDTRTRRSFRGQGIAPANLLGDSLGAQVPAGPLTDGRELLIVVSPAPVLGPHIMEQYAAPIYEMVADYKYGIEHLQRRGDKPCEPGGKVTGVEDADAESWGANEPAREELLKRLASYGKAIILSGDVHYACSLTLDFWTGINPTPARIVQLTSSASRNSFSDLVEAVLRSNALLQLYQTGIAPERLAWNAKAPITLPPGAKISPSKRSRMRRSPALLSTRGWPAGAGIPPDKQPDWRWRLKLVRDERPETSLPPDVQRPQLAAAQELVPANPASHVGAYRAVAARHQSTALTQRFRQLRQMVFTTNIGLVTITGSGPSLQVVHTLLSQEGEALPNGVPNTVHAIPLIATGDPAPVLQSGG